MGGAYYNEFDPGAAAWLRELIKRGLIADGVVDERSILDIQPDDLRGFTQVHFFAGIGGWSYALRLAGWPDDQPVWTGSPPCQPFSPAGRQKGKDDDRHLAPKFASLVGACRPGVLFGEQVASAAVFGKIAKPTRKNFAEPPEWTWLDDLCDRLEAARYAVGTVDLPAAGVGAPHIRQRTFFGAVRLADAGGEHLWGGSGQGTGAAGAAEGGAWQRQRGGADDCAGSADDRLADASADGSQGRLSGRQDAGREAIDGSAGCDSADRRSSPTDGFWRDADWLYCRDELWRPVIASFIEVAYGLSDRMVLCCDSISASKGGQKEEVNGPTADTSPAKALPILRGADGETEVWQPSGGSGGVWSQGLLRSSVYVESDGEGSLPEREPQSAESRAEGKDILRELRGGGEASRPSQGRKPFQQRPVELADLVPKLPSEIALAKLHGRRFAAQKLRALQSAVSEAGAVCDTPEQAASAWASLSQENQNWLRMGFADTFVEVSFNPLSRNEPARVTRLRGYGNAIVPQAAAVFIKSMMDIISP
jgi:DNA (cytosine-5)-methyltransferase 1